MGARGIELDRTAITFFGFCMLILVVVVICFQVKSNERLEEVGYQSFKECTLFIHKKSKNDNLESYGFFAGLAFTVRSIFILAPMPIPTPVCFLFGEVIK